MGETSARTASRGRGICVRSRASTSNGADRIFLPLWVPKKRRSCSSVVPSLPRGLLLEGTERSEVALSVDDPFNGGRTEGADQLVLQVRDAHVEAESLHVFAGKVGAEAGPLEAAPEVALLGDVTEARQSDVTPPRAEPPQEASDFFDPPMGTTETPSASRSRSRRAASASSASWSLIPQRARPRVRIGPRSSEGDRGASGAQVPGSFRRVHTHQGIGPSCDAPESASSPRSRRETGADRARIPVLVGHDVEPLRMRSRGGVPDRFGLVSPQLHSKHPPGRSHRVLLRATSSRRSVPSTPPSSASRGSNVWTSRGSKRSESVGRTARRPSPRRLGARTLAAAVRPGSPRTPRRRCFEHIAPRRRRGRSQALAPWARPRPARPRSHQPRAKIHGHPCRGKERRCPSRQRLRLTSGT